MNTIALLLLPVMLTAAAQAQLVRCQLWPGDNKPPSASFEWNQQFEHAVALPDRVVNILRTDPTNQKKLRECRGNHPEIAADWFAATRVKLADNESSTLLVKATHSCLRKEDTAPFWLFRETETDYSLMLSVETADLQVLEGVDHGYRDLCTMQGNYGTYWYTIYQYGGSQYEASQNGTINIDAFPPPPKRAQ